MQTDKSNLETVREINQAYLMSFKKCICKPLILRFKQSLLNTDVFKKNETTY